MDISEDFLRDTASHRMTVLHDQGCYQHLRFQVPDSSDLWFDLVATPGMTTWRSAERAFTFGHPAALFRAGQWDDATLHIAPDHWAATLLSDPSAARGYCRDRFTAYTAAHLAAAEALHPGICAAWSAFVYTGFSQYNPEQESSARAALAAFEFGAVTSATCPCGNVVYDRAPSGEWIAQHARHGRPSIAGVPGWTFPAPGAEEFTDFTWWFVFACSAIVWGLAQYDRRHAEPTCLAPQPAAVG